MEMTLIKISNEKSLLKQLIDDVNSCDKKKIVFLAGHFPLFYSENFAIEAIKYWGEFSIYSLELACQIGEYANSIGKKVKFVFFVDDHSYESFNDLSSCKIKTRRNKLYKEKSGDNAKLCVEYQEIMNKYGFNEDNVIRHDHQKSNRRNCLYFSEKILRTSELEINNICAREYVEFLEDPKYFNKENSYIISFVPNRCQGHICNIALDNEVENLASSHVFIETMAPMATRDELYDSPRGVTYRKD